jgi:hypothetical protein
VYPSPGKNAIAWNPLFISVAAKKKVPVDTGTLNLIAFLKLTSS